MKIIKYLFIFLIAFGVIGVIKKNIGNEISAKKLAMEINSSMKFPAQLDKHFRLDSVTATGNNLIFKYTLVNYDLPSIDQNLRLALEPAAKNDACESMKEKKSIYIKNNITFTKEYLNKYGSVILSVPINPAQCA